MVSNEELEVDKNIRTVIISNIRWKPPQQDVHGNAWIKLLNKSVRVGRYFHTRVDNCMLIEALEEYTVARDSENY